VQKESGVFSLARKNSNASMRILRFQTHTFAAPKTQASMAGTITFTMIKPEAVAAGNSGAILNKMEGAGFRIVALKKIQLSAQRAGKFYEVHAERPFYGELVEYMSSGPIFAAVLEKENAMSDFRALIGATDPTEAADGTIRKEFAESKAKNAVHGSDSDENAALEASFFFSDLERF
jgi:nucleoside-diphosphate kinase